MIYCLVQQFVDYRSEDETVLEVAGPEVLLSRPYSQVIVSVLGLV